jgi:hypothetical protein
MVSGGEQAGGFGSSLQYYATVIWEILMGTFFGESIFGPTFNREAPSESQKTCVLILIIAAIN